MGLYVIINHFKNWVDKKMKEVGLNHGAYISTCMTTCEKGIYETHKLEAQWGPRVKLPSFELDSKQTINCSAIKIPGGRF